MFDTTRAILGNQKRLPHTTRAILGNQKRPSTGFEQFSGIKNGRRRASSNSRESKTAVDGLRAILGNQKRLPNTTRAILGNPKRPLDSFEHRRKAQLNAFVRSRETLAALRSRIGCARDRR
jgi:hypothetical protein